MELSNKDNKANFLHKRGRFTLLAALFCCVLGAKGQEGYWFFVNCNINNSNNTNPGGYNGYAHPDNFYMRPAEYWYNIQNNTTNFTEDNGKPFLTTYKTNQDEETSLWLVEKVVEQGYQNYYTIKQVSSGKYLTVNDALPGFTKTHRMRVHLETLTTLSDRNYFDIASTSITGVPQDVLMYTISCLSNYQVVSGSNVYKSLNPPSGNQNFLTPTNNENPPTGGMIGFYTISDRGSKWVFEEPNPCISFTADDKVQITYPYYPSNATIYYTYSTDGNEPATPDPSSSTTYTYSGPFSIDNNASEIAIKAMAVRTWPSNSQTDVITFTSPVLPGSSRPYLFKNHGYVLDAHEGFYMQPGDVSNNEITVTTSSVGRPLMKWYFKSAGIDNGYQYFYIFNPESGNYFFCNSSSSVQMKTTEDFDGSSDDYKFRILTDAPGVFRIIPKARQTHWINKAYGNNANNRVNTATPNSGSTNLNNLEYRWNFIPVFNNQMPATTAPFTVSDATTTAYYKIGNASATDYFIVPGTTNATTSNSSDGDDMKWYFTEAGSDNWLTYYHIVNAVTGKYLYFCENEQATNNNDAFQTIDYSSENADRYQFVVANTTEITPSGNTSGKFYIVPKVLQDLTFTNYSLVWREGTNTLRTKAERADNKGKWTFTETDFTCATPEITINAAEGTATITCATPGASIYYVLYNNDSGPDPDLHTPSSPALSLYDDSPVDLGMYSYIKAIAARDPNGGDQSAVEGAAFHCITPTISFNYTTHQVTISSTPGSTIYYTTNGDPVTIEESTNHDPSPVTFSVTATTTIRAIAIKGVGSESEEAELIINKVDTPVIFFDGIRVTITCSTPNAEIHYEIAETSSVPDPDNSSPTYSIPLTGLAGKYIKAIAFRNDWITSDIVARGPLTPQCALPVIHRGVNNTFTIECSFPAEGSTVYYTTDNNITEEQLADDPTIGTIYTIPVNISTYPVTVKAIATADNYANSPVATQTINEGLEPVGGWYEIASTADFDLFVSLANAEGAGYNYRVIDDFTVSDPGMITQSFTGIFDGGSHTITGLTHPLFNTVNGGTVKNVTLKGVNINSTADDVGAIAGVAKGYSRIYNCGILPNTADFPDGENSHPKVKTSGRCAGGLVGCLGGDSRVINCYSYADVQATDTASGIVGNNIFASTAEESGGKYTKLRTAIVNCMFYGDIDVATNQYGVYGGKLITNDAATGINNYNYFRNGTKFTAANGHRNTSGGTDNVVGNPTKYNCSFPADERYLTQVEFHRSLLNSNRELCGWWVSSDVAPSTLTTTEVQDIPKDASLIYKWVVDPNLAPYPILKPFGKYPSIINGNTGTPWFDRTTAEPYQGKQLGTLSVTIKSGDHSSASDQTLTIPITDMDTLHYDFGYRKVQLPYYNTVFGNPNGTTWEEKYAGNYTGYVVTGWKVTAVTGGTQGSFVADWQDGYNFADRKCTDKDLYSVSGRVFAQGGNYYVPDGVTAITIEAYWGKAIYIRNAEASYDRVNIKLGSSASPNNYFNNGSHFAPAGTRGNNVNGATIQTATAIGSIRGALTAANIDAKKTVYDYALVLVGNVQELVGKNDVLHATQDTRGFTVMSVDLDFDEEPDYCLEWQLGYNMGRQMIAPIRFDFLPVIELGIAGKLHNSTNFFSLGCFRSKGHFEVTETSFIRFGQFEFELGERDEGPVILNGGIYDQYCRGRNGETNQHINYVILGGHIVMPSFTPGAHVNGGATYQTRHCAVNALGGDFTSFYLTGGFNENISPYEDNPHCYIDGGRFGTIAAAYKEGIWGDVTWRINRALIGEFYGGGVMSQATGSNYKIVKGNIDVVIDNSIVRKYCGGPKFGDMVTGKTVTTNATGTIFGHYYGAGNGGTNYVQYASTDETGVPFTVGEWNTRVNSNYHPKQYRTGDHSYEADYDFEVINYSSGDQPGKVVSRSYYYSAQFATTNTGNVTSTLTNCTVKNNFYGAGFLGGVSGTVTSTLDDTRVMGSAFGAGYSAASGTVIFHKKDKTPPVPNTYTGMITYNPGGQSETYIWTDSTTIHVGGAAYNINTGTPTVTGSNLFYTEVSLQNLGAVSISATLTIEGNSEIGTIAETDLDLEDGTHVTAGSLIPGTGNVFGGGDQSAVTGNTTVNLQGNATVHGSVYGGGNEGPVGGNSEVKIEGGN